MTITYNLDEAKQRIISLIKQNAYDFCTDMFREIQAAANNNDLDSVEDFVNTIRQVEKTSEHQVERIKSETCYSIAQILAVTAGSEMVGNVLYECQDQILEAIFGVKFEEQFSTDEELPF